MKLEDIKKGMRVRVVSTRPENTGDLSFVDDMVYLLGEEFTVEGVSAGYVHGKSWSWLPEWLEPAEEGMDGFKTESTYGAPVSLMEKYVGPSLRAALGDYMISTTEDSAGGINMIDKEKEYVDAGIEVDEERLKDEREALVETLRTEFWEPHIGGQILFNNGHGPAAEGTLLALSPSRDRMKVAYSVYSNEEGGYFPRDEWLSTNSILEFLPASDHPTVDE